MKNCRQITPILCLVWILSVSTSSGEFQLKAGMPNGQGNISNITRDALGCEKLPSGCSDEDGDGTPDYRDPQKRNPNVPIARDRRGCEEHALGCTDADDDGIPDYEDTTYDDIPCGLGAGCEEEDIANPDPTFVQLPPRDRITQTVEHRTTGSSPHGLVAKIAVPGHDALVRANVPIFGQAYGEGFKEYRVEYGKGLNPSGWTVIAKSSTPQTHDGIPDDIHDSPDITILGNLATWDTGLKNYVYLPSHPRHHPINLKGTYTLRVVVVSQYGDTVEDRVQVHVANVIPNAWGGIVRSPDGRVQLSVPEQSIRNSFRLILIHASGNAHPALPPERELVGVVYEVREPGERFSKNAVLKMQLPTRHISEDLTQIGIYGYDLITKEWTRLPSYRRSETSEVFCTITHLHAFYALMHGDMGGSTLEPPSSQSSVVQQTRSQMNHGHYLVQDRFEQHFGEWAPRDNEQGASISLDHTATFDGTHALKITNSKPGGNIAVNVRTTPFDAQEFPIVQFDYRIPPEVKTSFYAKVSGRWYEIRFTDDLKDWKHKRVNIAHIGDVLGIQTDGEWHSARFNLYDMLRAKTGHTVVESLIMADWDLGGYMRLKYGKNARGATYHIDNFSISRELNVGLQTNDDRLVVDNFNQKKSSNAFGWPVSTFQGTRGGHVRTVFHQEDATGDGHSLALSYDVSAPDSFSGYLTTLGNLDLRQFHALTFWVKGSEFGHDILIGLKDSSGTEEKIALRSYLPQLIGTTWKQVTIPLTAFSPALKMSSIENLSFSFVRSTQSQGIILVDDIAFQKKMTKVPIDKFETVNDKNFLGGKHWTFMSGAAAITGNHTREDTNGFYRLSYGGNIGDIKTYASDLFTYAGWTTQLNGVDCSECRTVSFRIRGAKGGEKPNVYLDDGNFRWGVDIEHYQPITTDWQRVTIPLHDFDEYGVDLTHLAELQIVFEWENMFGTIYVDDIQLGEDTGQRTESLVLERLPDLNENSSN